MRKTLYIHIGHYKTGTTALQAFMVNNTKFLERNKLAYARTRIHFAKHSAFAFALYKAVGVQSLMHGYDKDETPQELWAELFNDLRKSRQPRMVISSEEFMRLGGYPEAGTLLQDIVATAPDIDFRIIAYLRAPDSHLQSWYNQLVKMGTKVPEYNTAVPAFIEPVHYDYALALKPWIDIFGAEAVTVRPYAEAFREDDRLYRDFLSVFGVELPDHGVKMALMDPNPRMDDRMVEMARIMQNGGVPRDVVKWTVSRAQQYYEDESAGLPAPPPEAFEQVRQQTQSGLDGLQTLPDCGVDLAAYRARLPYPTDPEAAAGWRMAGLLLNELHFLRQRMTRENADLAARLRALEEAMANGKTGA